MSNTKFIFKDGGRVWVQFFCSLQKVFSNFYSKLLVINLCKCELPVTKFLFFKKSFSWSSVAV